MEPARTKEDVLGRVAERRKEIEQLGVAQLALFGSFRRDEAGSDSDVDFLVFFRADEKTYSNLFQLSTLLEQTLGRNVELVTPESLDSRLRSRIFEEAEYVAGLPAIHRPHS